MTIVKRGIKGTALTYDEMDENIRDLYQDTTIDRVLGNGNTTTKNVTVGTVSDIKGETRSIPFNNKSTSYSLLEADHGKCVSTSAQIIVPQNIFSIGHNITIYNSSVSDITIAQGSGVTMYQIGTDTTGNRTLAQKGLATILCVATNTFVIAGGGLS